MTAKPRYRIEVEALPSEVPATARLKRLLKSMLRAYQLRCVSVEEVRTQAAAPSANGAPHSHADAAGGLSEGK